MSSWADVVYWHIYLNDLVLVCMSWNYMDKYLGVCIASSNGVQHQLNLYESSNVLRSSGIAIGNYNCEH